MCLDSPTPQPQPIPPDRTITHYTDEELLCCCIDSFKWSNSETIALAHRALKSTSQTQGICHTRKASSFSSTVKKRRSLLSRWFHLVFLDIPLLVICTTSASLLLATLSARHLYNNYWTPIMYHLAWTPEKKKSRRTYYRRECFPSDVIPKQPDDMILDPSTTSPQEAADMVMRYGAAVFPDILSAESMAAMRAFVLKQNGNLNDDIEIPLISQNQRWSFAIGGDMDPSVPPILHEIATNIFLQSSLDQLLGPDPALVEFTAITSAYGAGSQNWHADSSFSSSYMHFARSFVPYYSLFIPLQDTTSTMGATSVCPGTHFCGKESNLGDMCENLGYQVSDTKDGVWRAGDGFLMHLNVYHRGPAHTDPNSPERVMLIMSIAPRPIGVELETRQLGLGTSYSQRWDMWGLTMKDLKNIEVAMRWPQKVLRTFGIYKNWRNSHDSNAVKWGWDYITVACSRIVNNQMGFRYGDLKKFVRKKRKSGILTHLIFGYLPDLVSGNETEERKYSEEDIEEHTGWREYIAETLRRLTIAASLFFTFYILFYLAAANLTRRTKGLASRVLASLIIAASLNGIFLHKVATSRWGQDVRNLRSLSDPFSKSASMRSSFVHSKYVGKRPSTLPSKADVFLSTRLDSHLFYAHNNIYDYQNGNQLWKILTDDVSRIIQSADFNLTSAMYSSFVANIVKRIEATGGRFVLQNPEGNWDIVASEDAIRWTDINIQAQSNIIRKKILLEIKYYMSSCRHGRLRNTVMSSSFCLLFLNNLQDALFPSRAQPRGHQFNQPSNNYGSSNIDSVRDLPAMVQLSLQNRQATLRGNTLFCLKHLSSYLPAGKLKADDLKQSTIPHQKFSEYDVVEGYFKEGWFRGTVIDFDENDTYVVKYDDGNVNEEQSLLRPFLPYESGQIVEADMDGSIRGRIKEITTDSTFSIIMEDGSIFDRVPLSRIHRIS